MSEMLWRLVRQSTRHRAKSMRSCTKRTKRWRLRWTSRRSSGARSGRAICLIRCRVRSCLTWAISMRDPFLIDGPTCISFSGGRTSAYMLWRVLQSNGGLPSDAVVCFANTGKEEEATLRFVDRCSREWGVPIAWVEYREGPSFERVTFDTAARNGEPMEAIVAQRRGMLPNRAMRFCSGELKTRTM